MWGHRASCMVPKRLEDQILHVGGLQLVDTHMLVGAQAQLVLLQAEEKRSWGSASLAQWSLHFVCGRSAFTFQSGRARQRGETSQELGKEFGKNCSSLSLELGTAWQLKSCTPQASHTFIQALKVTSTGTGSALCSLRGGLMVTSHTSPVPPAQAHEPGTEKLQGAKHCPP